jgi:predicted metal-dependent enzyme (double-stranded beta helix superfamily)
MGLTSSSLEVAECLLIDSESSEEVRNMPTNSLNAWTRAVRSTWDSNSADVVGDCRRYLERLALASPTEQWLASLLKDRPANRELYRDPEHGFVLLAHTEQAGLYRPPHDHGRSWVVYAVIEGEVEMGTYARAVAQDGNSRLIKSNSILMSAGQVQAYLPGDVHDTHCVTGPALLLRFTERDLQIEKREGRLTRYSKQSDIWTAEAA